MNWLRQKRCDIFRQRINEPDLALCSRCWLPGKELRERVERDNWFLINDGQSQNYSSP